MSSKTDSVARPEGYREELDKLRQRIVSLELRRKGWRVVVAVGLVMALGCVWAIRGEGTTNAIEAQRIVLVDSNGTVRASLVTDDNAVTLSLKDAKETSRLQLTVEGNGDSFISLSDADGHAGVQLQQIGDGRFPSMEFWDGKGSGPKISMGLVYRGNAYLNVFDKGKNSYWQAVKESK